MKIDGNTLDFFQSIPDDLLAEIAYHDMGALEKLCVALTLDIQIMKEGPKRQSRKKKKKTFGWLKSGCYIYVIIKIKVMALHKIIEKHQINILGQEITYASIWNCASKLFLDNFLLCGFYEKDSN